MRASAWYSAAAVLSHYLLSHLLTVITSLASTVMVFRLLSTSRTPQSLLAWVLGLVFIPLLAIPLYFLIGTRKFPRTAKRTTPLGPRATISPPGAVARVLHGMGAPPARDGNRLEILANGEDAYARLLALIASAERSIELTVFILGDDATGYSIIDALARRARAGVRVRVVLDAIGSTRTKRRAKREIEAAGGAVRAFMPLVHAPLRGRNNLRCHRKLVVVDGAKVFVGGMNFAAECMGKTTNPGRWRDIAAVVSGPVAVDAAAIFESDWAFCGGESEERELPPIPPKVGDNAVLQLVPSGPDMAHDTFYNAVLTALFAAVNRVTIVTPYYVPDDVLQRALVLAARRGVCTQLLVPLVSNHAVADFARRSLLRELTEAGVEVHFFPHGMVHAKAMVTDDAFAFIGSPNIDMRSLFLNYEDALCIYSVPDIAQVRAWVDALLGECTTTPPRASHAHWLTERVARILAPEL